MYRYINEADKKKLGEYYRRLTDDNISYAEYKRTYKAICNYMRLPADQVIIENLVFKKDDKDKEQDIICVKYSRGFMKVKIPEGVRLVHVSPADDIKGLNPSFRSKVKGKYMYPDKRCFFTVAKEIKPTQAGLEHKKLTRYTPTTKYTDAYIDPTYSEYKDRSVYIPTTKPIPVEKFETAMERIFGKVKETLGIQKKEEELTTEEAILIDEEVEALNEKFGDLDSIKMIKNWKLSNEKDRIKTYKSTTIGNDEGEQIDECIGKMRDQKVPFGEYKKAFTKFCRFIHTIPTGVILKKISFKKGKEGKDSTLDVEYSENTHKITLPEGTKLYHITTVPGITELQPQFRGKSEKGYLYDKPRVYFTIHKKMPKFLADYKPGTKTHTYECKEDIREVYVDPLVPSNIQGAVYVETNKPIKVEEVGLPKTSSNSSESEKTEEKKVDEAFDFDDFFDFVMETGLELYK